MNRFNHSVRVGCDRSLVNAVGFAVSRCILYLCLFHRLSQSSDQLPRGCSASFCASSLFFPCVVFVPFYLCQFVECTVRLGCSRQYTVFVFEFF